MELSNFKRLLKDKEVDFSENSSHIILKHCPNCDGKDKLNISKKNFLWQCFKCKGLNQDETAKGNLFSLLKNVLHLDSFQIRKILKDNELVTYVPETIELKQQKELEEQKIFKIEPYQIPAHWIFLDYSQHQITRYPEVYQYLISRFVDKRETIFKYELRYDSINMRLVFPAKNMSGECIGVQTRDITNRYKQEHLKCQNFKCKLFHHYYWFQEYNHDVFCPSCNEKLEKSFYPKASNSKNFPKTEFFYGVNKVDWTKPVALVEGPFDVINTPNAIGLLGRTLSDTQLTILINNLKAPLILYLDGDSAGLDSTIDVYKKVAGLVPDLFVCPLNEGDDPGSHSLYENSIKLSKLLKPLDFLESKGILL